MISEKKIPFIDERRVSHDLTYCIDKSWYVAFALHIPPKASGNIHHKTRVAARCCISASEFPVFVLHRNHTAWKWFPNDRTCCTRIQTLTGQPDVSKICNKNNYSRDSQFAQYTGKVNQRTDCVEAFCCLFLLLRNHARLLDAALAGQS